MNDNSKDAERSPAPAEGENEKQRPETKKGEMEKVTENDLKGKKVDADPSLPSDQPAR